MRRLITAMLLLCYFYLVSRRYAHLCLLYTYHLHRCVHGMAGSSSGRSSFGVSVVMVVVVVVVMVVVVVIVPSIGSAIA